MDETDKETKSDELPAWWTYYDGRNVCIQLKEAYIGVTGENSPVIRDGAPMAALLLTGSLRVTRGSNGGVFFVLRTRDPNPAIDTPVFIGIDPEQVRFITYGEAVAIIRP